MAFDIKDSLVFDTLMAANPTASLSAKKPTSSLEFTNLKDQAQTQYLKQQYQSDLQASLQNIPKSLMLAKRTKTFQEKLWYCGKHVGEISGRLTFYNLPILY